MLAAASKFLIYIPPLSYLIALRSPLGFTHRSSDRNPLLLSIAELRRRCRFVCFIPLLSLLDWMIIIYRLELFPFAAWSLVIGKHNTELKEG